MRQMRHVPADRIAREVGIGGKPERVENVAQIALGLDDGNLAIGLRAVEGLGRGHRGEIGRRYGLARLEHHLSYRDVLGRRGEDVGQRCADAEAEPDSAAQLRRRLGSVSSRTETSSISCGAKPRPDGSSLGSTSEAQPPPINGFSCWCFTVVPPAPECMGLSRDQRPR